MAECHASRPLHNMNCRVNAVLINKHSNFQVMLVIVSDIFLNYTPKKSVSLTLTIEMSLLIRPQSI